MRTSGFVRYLGLASAIAVAISVSGCILAPALKEGQPDSMSPVIEDFERKELNYSVIGTQEDVLRSIRLTLGSYGIPGVVLVTSGRGYVTTAYLREPYTASATRIQKTAYRISVGPTTAGSPCVDLGLTWLTRSRGSRDELWSVQKTDVDTTPYRLADVEAKIIRRRCTK